MNKYKDNKVYILGILKKDPFIIKIGLNLEKSTFLNIYLYVRIFEKIIIFLLYEFLCMEIF